LLYNEVRKRRFANKPLLWSLNNVIISLGKLALVNF